MAKITCIKCKKRFEKKDMFFAEARYTISKKNELHSKSFYMCERCAPPFIKEVSTAWNL